MSTYRSCAREAGWPLERVLFALAGTVTLLSVLLGACPASLVLGRAFGLRSALYSRKEVSR